MPRDRSVIPAKVGTHGRRTSFQIAMALLAALLLISTTVPAFAQVATNTTPLEFRTPAEEQRFHALAAELRCVMCQNQSLADSDAQIAHDLRVEVLALMRQGRSDDEVKQFLVQRYGEFVLYRPQVQAATWLLWFGPLLLLLGGAALVWRIVRGRARAASANDGAKRDNDAQEQEW
jgi:cytochrome c-type biogenesis protein CcmH